MKRLFLFLATFAFSLAMASSIGNPADPSILEEGFWISDQSVSSMRTGVTADVLFNKRLRPCNVSEHLGIRHPELEWKVAAFDVGCNIRERFDVRLLAGPVASVNLTWEQAGSFYEARGNQGLVWGGNAKLVVLEKKDTLLGLLVQGGGIAWIEGPFSKNGASSLSFSGHLHYWQVAMGLSQNMGFIRPYVGAVVNQLIYQFKEKGASRIRFQDLLQAGSYEGCSFSLGSKAFLNVEARQFFESGLTLSGELRF